MRLTRNICIFCLLLMGIPLTGCARRVPIGDVADRAVAQSKLTGPGRSPFRLKATIREKDTADSDYQAEVEILWIAPEKWRRTIQSPDFSQTLIVNGDKVFEQDTGDYYPSWLRQLVTALIDPLPMLQPLKQRNDKIVQPSDLACAQFQSKVGTPPAANTVFYVYCFEGEHGLIESVVTPGYSIEFKDYKKFANKRVARLLVTDAEPGTTIEEHITELSELKNADDNLFAVPRPTPKDQQLESIVLPEASLRSSSLRSPDLVWPPVRTGKTSGVLSIFVSIDRSGHIRETCPLNSDNPALNDTARWQLQNWQFKPPVVHDTPVQAESVFTFAFNTKTESPVTILSDTEARRLATHAVEPIFLPWVAPTGTSFTVRVSVGLNGKVQGITFPSKVSPELSTPAYNALMKWQFQPYLKEGKPDIFEADITFHVKGLRGFWESIAFPHTKL